MSNHGSGDMADGQTLIGWVCEDCDEALGDEPRMWDVAEQLRKEHEAETGHTTTLLQRNYVCNYSGISAYW